MKLSLPTKLVKYIVRVELSFSCDVFSIKKIIMNTMVSSDFTRAWQDCQPQELGHGMAARYLASGSSMVVIS